MVRINHDKEYLQIKEKYLMSGNNSINFNQKIYFDAKEYKIQY